MFDTITHRSKIFVPDTTYCLMLNIKLMVIDSETRDELNVPLHVYVCLQNKLMYKQ